MPKKKSIAEKTDKRRRARVDIGFAAAGKPVYKWAAGYTVQELKDSIDEIKRLHVAGASGTRRHVLVSAYIAQWYEAFKEKDIRASRKEAYDIAINTHIIPAIGQLQMGAATPAVLQKLLNSLWTRPGACRDVCMTLKQAFRQATAERTLDFDPTTTLKYPQIDSEIKRALTPEEKKAALSVGECAENGLLILLAYYLGVRRGEALGLKWGDIDFKQNIVSIRRNVQFADEDDTLKTKASYRDIPLPKALADILAKRKGLPGVYLLQQPNGQPYDENYFRRAWRALAREIYLYDPKHIENDGAKVSRSILTTHYFRHNYASMLYDAGVDVLTAGKWLGHKDVKTTLKIYTHLSEKKEQENTKKIDEVFAL